MDTFYKLTATDPELKCNVLKPFDYNKLKTEINPINGRPLFEKDIKAAKTSFKRIANSKSANIGLCCDVLDDNNVDQQKLQEFKTKFPYARPIYENDKITSYQVLSPGDLNEIDFETKKQTYGPGWQSMNANIICKIGKATILKTSDPYLYEIQNLTPNCNDNNCDNYENITLDHLMSTVKNEITYTAMDDQKVEQAIIDGNYDAMRNYLIKYNNSNIKLTHNDYNNNLFHIAAANYNKNNSSIKKKQQKIVELLYSIKTDFNAQNVYGNTPLHLACIHGNMDIVLALCRMNADTNLKNHNGETPIMLASIYEDNDELNLEKSNLSMVRILYNNGAKIDIEDDDGNNLLQYIILNTPNDDIKSKLVRYLLDRGINAEHKNKKGLSVLEVLYKVLEKHNLEKINEVIITKVEDDELNSKYGTGDFNTNELFEDIKNSNKSNKSNNSNNNKNLKNMNNVSSRRLEDLTDLERELLEIQTLITNYIIRTNEDLKGYVNVSKITEKIKGGYIHINYKQCSGTDSNLMGIEDEEQCKAMGGEMVDIINPTTMVKIELIPESEKEINAQEQLELYLEKKPESKPLVELPHHSPNFHKNIYGYNKNNNSNTSNNLSSYLTNQQTNNNNYNIDSTSIDKEQYVNNCNNLEGFANFNNNNNNNNNTSNKNNSKNVMKLKLPDEVDITRLFTVNNHIEHPENMLSNLSNHDMDRETLNAIENSEKFMNNLGNNISKTDKQTKTLRFIKNNILYIIICIGLIIMLIYLLYNYLK
jgi:ankyrin repeat protein